MIYVGIDPGNGGAYAVITKTGTSIYDLQKMGKELSFELMVQKFSEIVKYYDSEKVVCMVEATCHKGATGKAQHWKNGFYHGLIHAALFQSQIAFEIVQPAKWKKAMKVTIPRGTYKEKKELSIATAKRLFPEQASFIGRNDNRAEAILLADYCRKNW